MSHSESSRQTRARRAAAVGQRPMAFGRHGQSAGTARVRPQLANPSRAPTGERPPYPASGGFSGRQCGFSLIASLILLVLVTLVAVASMRTVSLQSRMSATTYDRNLAFQAAEAGMREAEALSVVATEASFPVADCVDGYCAQPAPADPARWADDAFNGWKDAVVAVSTGAATPGAIIERNGEGDNWAGCGQQIPREPNCRTPRYRVTGRSTAEGRATVILQSDVATQ